MKSVIRKDGGEQIKDASDYDFKHSQKRFTTPQVYRSIILTSACLPIARLRANRLANQKLSTEEVDRHCRPKRKV